MNRWKKYLLAGVAAVAVTGGVLIAANPQSTKGFKIAQNIEILVNMFRDLNLFYVDEIDPDSMLETAAAGMVKNLDPYTELIPAKDMGDFETMTTGKYGGIGSLIRKKGDYVIIADPYKGSPADRAGLRIGDKIVEISGEDAKGFDPSKVSSMLKGDPGTTVKLKVEKFATGEVVPVSIVRERIKIPGVPYYGFVSDSIGYIHHSDFTEESSSDMHKALTELKKSGKLKGLILDYRGNGGGILQEAVKILSMYLPNNTEVVSMKGKMKQLDATFRTKGEPVDLTTPIVVLTGPSSASAAEIVSGALQDMDRAVLMGQRTFGKGLVQSTRPTGYNSYLKVTTAKYYIPSGRCIQAIDYAHKNADGSVGYVPDSLIKEFTTRNGRKVYDGGGVMPDVKLPADYASRFAMIVYGRGYIDDFVDEYMKRNSKPVDMISFKLTDKDYNDFVAFMQDKDIEYESESKQALKKLRDNATREKYIDNISAQLDKIEQGLKDDKQSNLQLYRKELSDIIEDAIILRSHYSQGVAQHRIQRDNDIKAAIELLNDKSRYQKIITTQDTERK